MSVDPALWETFQQARNNLLSALRASIDQNEPRQHIHTLPLAGRSGEAFSLAARATLLDGQIERIQAAENELSTTRVLAVKCAGRIRQSVSPVGRCPPEILREIFGLAVTPHDHQQIMDLASVCDLWRTVIISTRHLFSEPDWKKWPVSLLRVWCARGVNCPLSINVERNLERRLRTDVAYALLLQEHKPRWRVLRIDAAAGLINVGQEGERLEFGRYLFEGRLPSLQTLEYNPEASLRPHRNLPPLEAPGLCSMSWVGSPPPLNCQSMVHLSNCSIYMSSQQHLLAWFDIFTQCPVLTHLKLRFGRGGLSGEEVMPSSSYMLANLEYLAVAGDPRGTWGRFLSTMLMPSVEAVNITGSSSETVQLLIPLCPNMSTLSFCPGSEFGGTEEIREVMALVGAQQNSALPALKNVQICWNSEIALEILNSEVENAQRCFVELAKKFKLETLEVPFITDRTLSEITVNYGTVVKVIPWQGVDVIHTPWGPIDNQQAMWDAFADVFMEAEADQN